MSAELDVHEWTGRSAVRIGPLHVTPFEVRHPVEAYAVRVRVDDPAGAAHVLVYSGDTDACDGLDGRARGGRPAAVRGGVRRGP